MYEKIPIPIVAKMPPKKLLNSFGIIANFSQTMEQNDVKLFQLYFQIQIF